MKRHLAAVLATLIVPLAEAQADEDLVAHWKLISDAKEAGGNHHAINHGVEFKDNAAVFNGIDAWLEGVEGNPVDVTDAGYVRNIFCALS